MRLRIEIDDNIVEVSGLEERDILGILKATGELIAARGVGRGFSDLAAIALAAGMRIVKPENLPNPDVTG